MEFMASLQGGVDELKPSLFELLSEQQLVALLPPSLRYLLATATYRHPRYLLRILNSFDEVYALLMVVVERYYLKTYGGSFTENFYGLKRERVLRTRGGEVPRAQIAAAGIVRETLRLRERDVWKNIAISVGLPYVKRKLDESHDIYAPSATLLGPSFDRDLPPPNATIRQRLLYHYKWFLRTVYPSINAAYHFALLAFSLAYLFDSSKYHSPFLWLVGTRMRRMGRADYQAIEALDNTLATSDKPVRPGQANSLFNPRLFFSTVYPRLLSSLRILLPTSIFALKFLEWWHASDFARQLSRKAAEGLELPPPIISTANAANLDAAKARPSSSSSQSPGKSAINGTKASLQKPKPQPAPVSSITYLPIFTVPPAEPPNSGSCPICNKPVTTATASPYGYVYCYVCIHKWVEGIHERQERFMEGGGEEEAVWTSIREYGGDGGEAAAEGAEGGSREGNWESGKGRCAVSGRRILGGTEGLRRVVV